MTLTNSDQIVIFLGLPLSAILGLILFTMRRKGSFEKGLPRLMYFVVGVFNAAIAGVSMHIADSYGIEWAFYCGGVVVLYYVFIYNTPLRQSNY